MGDVTIIDTKMSGCEGITAAFVVQGETTALVETGPKSSVEHVLGGLEAAGIETLHWIVVTHIHLDHAGAAGTLAKHFPEATVVVHEKGAPHLVDPSKLWASASRIYGDAMESLWGGIDPIPGERITTVAHGEAVDLGGRRLTAVETPGHARHHHAFVDSSNGVAFVGDALGVRLPDVGLNRPATPPPEFDLHDALASIARIKELGASSLWLTHFGPADAGANPKQPAEACDEAADALREWTGWVASARERTHDLREATAYVRRRSRSVLEDKLDDAAVDRLEHTTSYDMNVSGIMRALDKAESAG